MDPSNNPASSGASLAAPIQGQPTAQAVPVGTVPQTTFNNVASVAPAVIPIPAIQQTAALGNATGTDVPQVADDSDLIEKEWVDRAKRIVKTTLENPYEQSRELTNLKAEYMKKRYNRDIRQSE